MADKLSGSAIEPGTITSVQLSSELGPVTSQLELVGSGVSLNVSNNAVFSGNIAIGVSSPLARTHIIPKSEFSTAYNNYDGDALFIDDANANTGAGNYGGAISWSRLSNPPSRKAAIAIFQDTADINQNGLAFFVSPGANSSDPLEEALRISSNKNVGIGTSLPSQKLHVSGNTYISGNVGIGTISPEARLHANSSGIPELLLRLGPSSDFALDTKIIAPSSNLSSMLFQSGLVYFGGNFAASIGYGRGTSSDDGFLTLGTNDSERVRVTSDGNVGIGTTSPSFKLEVEGTIDLPVNTWFSGGGFPLLRNSYFGYSSGYRVAQLGTTSNTTSAISLGADVTSNPSGAFTGYEIIIPNNRSIIAPNSVDNGYVGVLKADSSNNIIIGGNYTQTSHIGNSSVFYNRVSLTFPSELMFNGIYTNGVDKSIEAGRAARIEYLKDEFIRFQGSASVAADTGVAFSDKVKIDIANGGILFGSDTSASNTLDDYEEGDWTPTGSGVTFSVAVGRYNKIGRQVTVWWQVEFPSTASADAAVIGGLPFTVTLNSWSGALAITNVNIAGVLAFVHNGQTSIFHRNPNNDNYTNSTFSGKFSYGCATYIA